ncbi:hypothetical protein ScPMuIL_015811 [Solemya velum]
MSTHSEPHREGQGSPEFPTPQDPGNPSTETDPEDLGSQMDSVSEKRIRSHTDKGAVYYEGIVNSHTSKLVQTRCDIDAVVDSVARKAKTESELLAHKEQLSELCNQYKEQSREFIEFLHHAHTAQSKQEVVSQELILSNVVAKVNSMFEQIHYMIKHSQEETKSIPASHTSGKSKSSSVSSILLQQRAKVEATKAALDFAKQEAELKRKKALIEEQAMKAKAEEIRRKSEVQLDIDILNRTRDAVVADAELSAMRDELDELHLDNIGSVVDNTERTTQYVLKHTKVEPIVPEHSVPLMLNPHAMPFVSQDPPVVSSATPNIPNPVNQAKSNVVESSSANTPNQHNSNVAEPISANANLNVAASLTLKRVYSTATFVTSRRTFRTKVLHQTLLTMAGEPDAKKLSKAKKIGTHNGVFHCDEVLACSLLRQLPQYQDAEVIRTRDPSVLSTCDVVVDVGGVFDPKTYRFDHHQRTFTETMNSLCPDKKWVTRLSSAGLVYLHYGREILAKILNTDIDDPVTGILYDKMYEEFVEEIDAIDNGVKQFDGEPRYIISTTLSRRVGNLNPAWNEPDIEPQVQFEKAMKMVMKEFLDKILYFKKSWLPARDIVLESVKARAEVHPSGEIFVLSTGCPWVDHLFTLEEELNIKPGLKYALYEDNNGMWRVHSVPVWQGSFENRLPLPEEWRGLRDSALSEKAGIPDCTFVHASGFIGGNKTKEGALMMAVRSLEMKENSTQIEDK